jgi:hypothetical protein
MAQAVHNVDAERAAVIFYGGALLTTSLLLSAMWRAVARRPALHGPEVSNREIDELLRVMTPSIGFYVGAGLLALAQPQVAVLAYLLTSILAVLRARGDETAPPADVGPYALHESKEEA